MDPSQANPREYLRQAIDAEIKTLERSIRALKHRRNALAPVSSLPTEVILTIFTLLRTPGELPFFIPDKKPDHPEWLRVAHVCHQWREIALRHPLFWSHLDFTTVSSAGAAEILARAKKVPLHLEANVYFGQWDEARFSALRKELQDHVSHIRHLEFSAADLIQLNRTFKNLTSPAPILECLHLKDGLFHPVGTTLTVSNTLFDGSTPRLSCLKLYRCNISWESPLLKGLEHLDLNTPSQRPSLSVWLDALDEMPHLKTLALKWASPIAPPNALLPSRVERTVSLPFLKLLEISTDARDCGLALTHLVLPALTSMHLWVLSCHPDGSDVPEIISYVTRHANRLQYTQPLQSVFVQADPDCVNIVAWTLPDIDLNDEMDFDLDSRDPFDLDSRDLIRTKHSTQVVFSIVGEDWSDLEAHRNIFQTVIADLPLRNLVTLAVHKHTELDKQFWIRYAPQWPLLQHMQLGPAAHRFEEMLLQENNGRCKSPLLPLLKKLVLVELTLSASRTLHLCDALMNRVEQGAPLETLDLRKCHATSRAVELLSEIVVEVLDPEQALMKEAQRFSKWDSPARGFFIEDDSSEVKDDQEDNTYSNNDDEAWEIGETDDDPVDQLHWLLTDGA
jgi:hypothetical protein